MIRLLYRLSAASFWLGALISIPGLLLLLASSGLAWAAVNREQAAHDLALDQECL